MTDLALFIVFAGVAVLHHIFERRLEHKHWNLHWLMFAFHPVTLVAFKDWLIHITVYSKYALIAAH